jgi:hypothetical protein
MSAAPATYRAKLDEIADTEEKAGRRVIHSPAEWRQYLAEKERQRAEQSAAVLNDKPAGGTH